MIIEARKWLGCLIQKGKSKNIKARTMDREGGREEGRTGSHDSRRETVVTAFKMPGRRFHKREKLKRGHWIWMLMFSQDVWDEYIAKAGLHGGWCCRGQKTLFLQDRSRKRKQAATKEYHYVTDCFPHLGDSGYVYKAIWYITLL